MLRLRTITKKYRTGDTSISALKGVSLVFRESEFVSILGQSGCGKTTLLNIIGGLDRYTNGDLIISGVSTKKYTDADWDTYRNHTIGFVFQSYNLIPHQSVLANVELALTLSGVSRAERREKAKKALQLVGLGDQISKKPNQLSGGQMQRVAIARALVNNPEILLADEPTGALDSETSVQIMELLKEISKDRLVIMVTHNPELAEQYSTRIVRLADGKVVDDTNPCEDEEEHLRSTRKIKRPSMSMRTAFSLSVNNLLTKKARTVLTAFAGSIGIIGIALILSLSSGVNAYINRVEEDTLSNYPVSIEKSNTDVSELVNTLMDDADDEDYSGDMIYSNNVMTEMMTAMINGSSANDLAAFKTYLEEDNGKKIKPYVSDIKYTYDTVMHIYTPEGYKVNPSEVFEKLGFGGSSNQYASGMGSASFSNTNVWQELLDNKELLNKQYEVVAGKMPENSNEVVVIVDEHNRISDYTLYTLGLKDANELTETIQKAMNGEKIPEPAEISYSYDEILGLSFRLLLNSDYFVKDSNGLWVDKSNDSFYILDKLKTAQEVNVVGIIRANSNGSSSSANGAVGYLSSLMTDLINNVNNSEVVKEQMASPERDIFTGLEFSNKEFTLDDVMNYIANAPKNQQMQFATYLTEMKDQNLTEKQIIDKFAPYMKSGNSTTTYEENLLKLGSSDINRPASIKLYPKDFESKEKITDLISEYNSTVEETQSINYTDYIGIILSSVTTIINAISYILIAFVSISLIVSSIMIGIITYISVLERTKEIGILRAMGASKKNVSSVFNAETTIVGLFSGLLGIGVTLLFLIPINSIIYKITEIENLAVLPPAGAVTLVIISVLLTFVAGLIPSKLAAKKEPVTALRTE